MASNAGICGDTEQRASVFQHKKRKDRTQKAQKEESGV
jgi:hypothetical protein